MNSIKDTAMPLVKVMGRTSAQAPVVLFWTGSRYEMDVKAANLSVVIKASYEVHEQWIVVLCDGAVMIRMPLQKGDNVIPVLRNRNPETLHHIRIVKDSPVLPGDGDHYIELTDILSDGALYPVKERRRKLVFVGDSITSGEGGSGAQGEADWVSAVFSATDNYAYMTADALRADYQAISQSGWGVCCGYDNDARHNMPKAWHKVCALSRGDGPERDVRGSEEEYRFDAFIPDAVIINLATNDGNGVNMPPFTDPDTGVAFAMTKGPDGGLSDESTEVFTERAVAFLTDIRCTYPAAKIIWCYGMLGYPMKQAILTALHAYSMCTGDEMPLYVELAEAKEDSFGARWHPGRKCHKQAADRLVSVLSAMLPPENGET